MLTPIKTPLSPNELAKKINDNMTDLDVRKADETALSNYIPNTQLGMVYGVATLDGNGEVDENAKTATTAQHYASTGSIKSKFDTVDSETANVKNGNTIVGKARTLEPAVAPGNDMYFGTSPSGTVGWYSMPVTDDGGEIAAIIVEPFAAADERWGAAVDGIYALTVPHSGKYPLSVFRDNGAAMYEQISVDVQRNNTYVLIRAMEPFGGYVTMG